MVFPVGLEALRGRDHSRLVPASWKGLASAPTAWQLCQGSGVGHRGAGFPYGGAVVL